MAKGRRDWRGGDQAQVRARRELGNTGVFEYFNCGHFGPPLFYEHLFVIIRRTGVRCKFIWRYPENPYIPALSCS